MKKIQNIIKKVYGVSIGTLVLFIACVSHNTFAQRLHVKADLLDSNRFHLFNRSITLSTDKQGKNIIHLNSNSNAGVAWINNLTFGKGIIEFDVKGKNILQQSFVGIAFHGLNDSTYDAIYFRPFNFQSTDSIKRSHSVQYISLPEYDWPLLRERHPGKYENALINKTDPESWFHVKIVTDYKNITVFVNKDQKPSLVVKPLSNTTTGKIGFWVGNNSSGDFANLSIQNK
ncbi:MAG: hypothetical protein WKG06_32620 [Segetibacter sp.]